MTYVEQSKKGAMLLLRRPPLRRARTAAVAMGRRAFASHGMDAFMEFEREMALKKRSENPVRHARSPTRVW